MPKLKGYEAIIKIDESKFGNQKYNKNHKIDGVWVFGMVEKTD